MKSIEILDAPALCPSSSPDSSQLCATTDSRQDNCALHKALTQHSVAKEPPQFGKRTNLQPLNQTQSSSYVVTIYLTSICISLYFWISIFLVPNSPACTCTPSSCGRSTTKEGPQNTPLFGGEHRAVRLSSCDIRGHWLQLHHLHQLVAGPLEYGPTNAKSCSPDLEKPKKTADVCRLDGCATCATCTGR